MDTLNYYSTVESRAHLVRAVTYCNTVTIQCPAQYVQYIDVLMQ